MTTYRIPISNGIFAHRKRIGAAIWVFLWLIDKTTKEVEAVDGESMDGLVFGGRPVTMSAVAGDLQMSINGVRDQLSQLLKGGYIRAIQHGAGIANGYAVLNSKKWGRSGTHEEESEAVVDPTGKLEGSTGKVEGPPIGKVEGVHRKTVGGPPENCGGSTGKLPQHNRKDNTNNTKQSNTTNGELTGDLTLFGDDFLTPEQAKARAESEALAKVWNHYLEQTGRNSNIYEFSESRRDKGLLRLRECAQKAGGDYDKAAQLMCVSIDALVASDWHAGRDPRTHGKRYLDWERNLFKSYDQMEKWWNE